MMRRRFIRIDQDRQFKAGGGALFAALWAAEGHPGHRVWGVPAAAARLYGYLLLCPRPVSLDEITEALGISKSSASVAARLLESYTLARRHREAGTKRALYAVADDFEAMIRQQNQLIDALAAQLRAGAGIVASRGR